jgi:cysteine desulfuration protein SufE
VNALPPIADIADEYAFLDSEDRYRLLIDLGRKLEPMPDALKTDATKVRGCSASVWVYPTRTEDGRLHFLADSNAAITKGIVARRRLRPSTSDKHLSLSTSSASCRRTGPRAFRT